MLLQLLKFSSEQCTSLFETTCDVISTTCVYLKLLLRAPLQQRRQSTCSNTSHNILMVCEPMGPSESEITHASELSVTRPGFLAK